MAICNAVSHGELILNCFLTLCNKEAFWLPDKKQALQAAAPGHGCTHGCGTGDCDHGGHSSRDRKLRQKEVSKVFISSKPVSEANISFLYYLTLIMLTWMVSFSKTHLLYTVCMEYFEIMQIFKQDLAILARFFLFLPSLKGEIVYYMAHDFVSKRLQCKKFCKWVSEVCVEYTAPVKTSGIHFHLSARKKFLASTSVNILSRDTHPYFCSCLSFFGRAFEKAAESTSSRTLHNHFQMSSE